MSKESPLKDMQKKRKKAAIEVVLRAIAYTIYGAATLLTSAIAIATIINLTFTITGHIQQLAFAAAVITLLPAATALGKAAWNVIITTARNSVKE